MPSLCKTCARPLKPKNVVRRNEIKTVYVCKSPICKSYNKEQ